MELSRAPEPEDDDAGDESEAEDEVLEEPLFEDSDDLPDGPGLLDDGDDLDEPPDGPF